MLIATVYLLNVLNTACTICAHGCNQQRDTSTDVWALHATATKGDLTVMAYNDSTMRIAEDYLGTHIYEFVDKDQATLEHLLMEQYGAASLCGNNDEY